MIRRLKEENGALYKEESKAKSTTDMSDSPGDSSAALETILAQLHSNPQLRSAVVAHIQNEAYDDGSKSAATLRCSAGYNA